MSLLLVLLYFQFHLPLCMRHLKKKGLSQKKFTPKTNCHVTNFFPKGPGKVSTFFIFFYLLLGLTHSFFFKGVRFQTFSSRSRHLKFCQKFCTHEYTILSKSSIPRCNYSKVLNITNIFKSKLFGGTDIIQILGS